MKIITVVGARPQFIKAAVVSRAIESANIVKSENYIKELIIHTGQHYDANMSDIFFEEMNIPKPDYHLGVMGVSHGAMTGRMLEKIEEVLLKERPDVVIVYGDTNSTLAGALAAVKLHIPVAHVEAGLRSFNRKMPEEINRVLTDHCSDLLFVPSDSAVVNLRKEGIPENRLCKVGDVMYDAALFYNKKADTSSNAIDELKLDRRKYILATIHRAESTDNIDRLATIIDGLILLSEAIPVVLPLHPRTKAALKNEGLLDRAYEKVRLLEPLGYLDMIMLEKNAALIATDSGGVQKEAYFFRVPCVTLRDETEWVELIDSGWNILCPPSSDLFIYETIIKRIGTKGDDINLFGKGTAAKLIVNRLQEI